MNNEQTPSPAPELSKPREKLNEYLRRVRESKRITLEKMARDTKLNLDYLYALEEGDYRIIPAETYIRIYLRSVAKYLQIDPVDIVWRYQDEVQPKQQQQAAVQTEERKTTLSLRALAQQPKIKPAGIVILILGLMVIFSFLRTGYKDNRTASVPDSALSGPLPKAKKDTTAVPGKEADLPVKTEEIKTEKEPAMAPAAKDTMLTGTDRLLTIRCERESCWVMIFRDHKKPWRLILHKNETRYFRAKRDFHVTLGQAALVTVFLDNKKVELPKVKNILRFSIGREELKVLSYQEWANTFSSYRDFDTASGDSL